MLGQIEDSTGKILNFEEVRVLAFRYSQSRDQGSHQDCHGMVCDHLSNFHLPLYGLRSACLVFQGITVLGALRFAVGCLDELPCSYLKHLYPVHRVCCSAAATGHVLGCVFAFA